MNNDNKIKSEVGKNNENELKNLISTIESSSLDIYAKSSNPKFGYKGKNQKQFSATSKISFLKSKETWIIFTSNSFRTDRIKGKEFDAENIKKIEKENGNENVKAFFILPNEISQKDLHSLDIYRKNKNLTYFDKFMILKEFKEYLIKKGIENNTQGINSNIIGNISELSISNSFNNDKNIKKWNSPENQVLKSNDFYILSSFMIQSNINKKIDYSVAFNNNKKDKDHYLKELDIVTDINGKKNFGKPKTDVLVHLKLQQEKKETSIRFSIKHPKKIKGKTTVHEGSVQNLLSDLKNTVPQNSKFKNPELFQKLSSALLEFQEVGSAKNMTISNKQFLEKNLSDLNEWLINYFMFGINNSKLNKNQVANYLAIVDPNNGEILFTSSNNEVKKLIDYCKNHSRLAFGTPFSWTYPSKKRGTKIQIKAPL